jgi:plastocyanin
VTRRVLVSSVGSVIATTMLIRAQPSLDRAQTTAGGTVQGHVRLSGPPPGNTIIRMGVDPRCSQMNAGKRVVQEAVVTSTDGSLANVFVNLTGPFPSSLPPADPVTIDQRRCIYVPRVVGARVGQTLEFRNSDETLHNVHSLSIMDNDFNVGQPVRGTVYRFQLKREEVMLHVKCDVHRWMTTYIGVVSHPYFAVSDEGGGFTIAGVPAGTHTIQVWHERYGPLIERVTVKAGETTTVDFAYTGTEKPSAIREVAVQAFAIQ